MISSVLGNYLALEAEDITNEVADASADITGAESNNDGDIDTNTDDILGTKASPDDQDNSENIGDDAPPNIDDSSDSYMGDSTQDMNQMDSIDENDSQKDTEFESIKKKQLWDAYKKFHEVLDDSIDLIVQYVPGIADASTIEMMKNIKENLINSRDLVYRTIVDEYPDISYAEMMKRYIGLKHIYDITTNELEEYFDKYRDEIKR